MQITESGDVGETKVTNISPDAKILPRSGTHGVMSLRGSTTIFPSSSQRTAEHLHMSKLMRTRIARRTHDSGILIVTVARESDNGSAWSRPWKGKDVMDSNMPMW